jgi:hypothetical protein
VVEWRHTRRCAACLSTTAALTSPQPAAATLGLLPWQVLRYQFYKSVRRPLGWSLLAAL